MNNQKILIPIIIAFVAAIIFGGIFYFFLSYGKPSPKITSSESEITVSKCEDGGGAVFIVNSFLPDICPICESCYERREDPDDCNTQDGFSICDLSMRPDCESCFECMNKCPYGMKKIGEISDMAIEALCCKADLVIKKCDYDSNSNKRYVGKSGDECSRAFINCLAGERIFSDECGCGCEKIILSKEVENERSCITDSNCKLIKAIDKRYDPTLQDALYECFNKDYIDPNWKILEQDDNGCSCKNNVCLVPDGPMPPGLFDEIDTSSWQAYRNEEYWFEFRYPADWADITEDYQAEQGYFYFTDLTENVSISIIWAITKGGSLFDDLQKLKPQEKYEKDLIIYTKIDDVTIGGYPAVKFFADRTAIPAEIPSGGPEVLVRNNRRSLFRTFHFKLNNVITGFSDETLQEKEALFNQILSTFKFIDSVDVDNGTKNCNSYEMPMTQEEIDECTCPEGYEKFRRFSGAYCATNSQIPCSDSMVCPEGEICISHDTKNWFCTGQGVGCYYNDPENPEMQICVD